MYRYIVLCAYDVRFKDTNNINAHCIYNIYVCIYAYTYVGRTRGCGLNGRTTGPN